MHIFAIFNGPSYVNVSTYYGAQRFSANNY